MTTLAVLTVGHIHAPSFIKTLKGRTDIQIAGVYDTDPLLVQAMDAMYMGHKFGSWVKVL